MRPENEAKLRKIRTISSVLQAGCTGFLFFIVIGYLMGLIALIVNRGGSVAYFDVWFRVGDLMTRGRCLVLVLATLTSAVWYWGVVQLRKMFDNYSDGKIFTREAVGHMRQMGVACVFSGVMKVMWVALQHVVSKQPPGPVLVSSETIPIGILVIIVAWFMDMAVDLQEENELTV